MQHNLPPSQFFNEGATYSGDTMTLVAPDGSKKELTGSHLPKIAHNIGDIAVKRAETALSQDVGVVDIHTLGDNSYAGQALKGPATYQADIESAAVQNIQNAAAAAGMTVDQWKAARHRG